MSFSNLLKNIFSKKKIDKEDFIWCLENDYLDKLFLELFGIIKFDIEVFLQAIDEKQVFIKIDTKEKEILNGNIFLTKEMWVNDRLILIGILEGKKIGGKIEEKYKNLSWNFLEKLTSKIKNTKILVHSSLDI